MPQELDFSDLSPQEVRVRNLLGKNYLLKEVTADVAVRVENWRFENATFDEKTGKLTGSRNFAGATTLATGLSLYEANVVQNGDGSDHWTIANWTKDPETGRDKPVPVGRSFVDDLTHHIQLQLYKQLVAISPDFEPKTATKLDLERQIDKLKEELARIDGPKDVPGDGPGSIPSPTS